MNCGIDFASVRRRGGCSSSAEWTAVLPKVRVRVRLEACAKIVRGLWLVGGFLG